MDEKRILKPLTAPQILDETFYLIKDNFMLFLIISLIPKFLVGLFYNFAFNFAYEYGVLFIVLYMFLDCIIQAAGIYVISRRYLGYSVGLMDTCREGLRNVFSIFAIIILASIVIIAGGFLLIIPGLIFYIWFFLAIPVYMIEGISGWSALMRSRELVRGRFFTALGFFSLIMVINLVLYAILDISIPDTTAIFRFSETFIQQAINALTALMLMVLTIVLYFDIRVKREGFDLDMLAASLESKTSDQSNKQSEAP